MADASGAAQPHFDADFPPLEIRRPADRADPGARYALEPHGLPNTRRARIPDRMRFELPVLFAARLLEIARVVVRAHDDLEAALRVDVVGDVDRERRVAAFVVANGFTV